MRKRGIWLLGALFITVVSVLFAFMIEKITVTASEIALTKQGLYVKFSEPLNANAIQSDHLYITSSNGKKSVAKLTLDKGRRIVHVQGLEPGKYTLHIKRDAFKGKPFSSLSTNELKFTMRETIESVSSAKELTDYFKQALTMRELQGHGVEMEVMEDSAASGGDSGKSKSTSDDHSTTNTQVEGVDEADLVKTDGDYIYATLGDGKVSITDIRNPKQMKIASEITMEEGFYPSELFLHEDMLLVLGGRFDSYPMQGKMDSRVDRMPGKSMTTIRLYDVSAPENPLLIREVGAEGYLNGARKVENILYFITNVQPNFWMMEKLYENELLPYVIDSSSSEKSMPLDYQDISILPGAMEPTYTVITAIDLSSPAEGKVVTKGYLGASEQLYMSANNLYLTATNYGQVNSGGVSESSMIWNPGSGNSDVFKFTLNGTLVTFQSTATLKGSVLNQFSMDEHDGYFRVVTTEGNMWDENNVSKNHLFILDENLKVTGSVEGLAKGERIYSARFMGDKAYMVTFRETDPLFVIDVANPTAPKVLGELKIPGFSNYLHPLDENHLIGFGYETVAEKNPQGGEPIITTKGMKISLFDISDFTNPKEKDTEIIGESQTYSPVQYNHKALFQNKKRSLFGFPVTIYKEKKVEGTFSDIEFQSMGALVYEITSEKGIELKGNLLEEKVPGEQYGDYEKEIQRLISSNDVIYTISLKAIKNYSLDTFTPIGELSIQ
ncbi:beta-propeller domain-containing protein [Sporosarcina siberiensis]|uniref:Beta-propeller domain-containing protein n=1 Tax=Sporosarcina siberiensis TaxID=1365606 RepID=A0ABW4SDM8_9BACL